MTDSKAPGTVANSGGSTTSPNENERTHARKQDLKSDLRKDLTEDHAQAIEMANTRESTYANTNQDSLESSQGTVQLAARKQAARGALRSDQTVDRLEVGPIEEAPFATAHVEAAEKRTSDGDRRTTDRRRSARGLFEIIARRQQVDRRQLERRGGKKYRLAFWR